MSDNLIEFPDVDLIVSTEEMVISTFLQSESYLDDSSNIQEFEESDDIYSGSIAISGCFPGVITVSSEKDFLIDSLRRIVKGNDFSESAIRDFLAEMTNVIGGNIKSLFSMESKNICFLSLPIVAKGSLMMHGEAKKLSHLFSVSGGHVLVSIHALESHDTDNNVHVSVGMKK